MAGASTVRAGDPVPQRIEVGGLSAAYRRGGSGEPLLYLHGMGLTGRWRPLHQALAESFDVIAPEHPGFGATARPSWYRDLQDMVLHYDELLDALGLQQVHLVGHSFGGVLAAHLAVSYPKRFATVTLIAVPLNPPPPPPGGPPSALDFDELLFNGYQDRYPEYRDATDPGLLVADGDGTGDPPGDWTPLPRPTLQRHLRRISAPSQLVVPDEDRLIDRADSDRWIELLGARRVEVTGRDGVPTGHLLVVQEPEAIAAAVAELAATAPVEA